MPEKPLNIKLSPPVYERLWGLASLTRHTGASHMAKRLIDIALVEEPCDIHIPTQPDRRYGPTNQVFMRLNSKSAAALEEGAKKYDIASSRFGLYVVEHAIELAAHRIPYVDELVAYRASFLAQLSRDNAVYLPLSPPD
jgi:hypothetical protein